MLGRLARLASLAVIVAQPACASRLDFDSVSAEWDAAGDQAAASEAGVPSDVDARDPSMEDARDASTGDARGTSMDDVARAPRGELPKDAATPEAGPSALSDAGALDGSAHVDAEGVPPSASDAAAAATMFSCAQQTREFYLCEDFESYAAFSVWGRRDVIPLEPEPAGSIDLDNRGARAGQSSLLAVVNPAVSTCAGCDVSVFAWWPFHELDGHVELSIEFDMRVEQIDSHPGGRSSVFRFVLGSLERGFSRHVLQLRSTGTGTEAAFIESDIAEQPAGSTVKPIPMDVSYDWQPGPRRYDWVHVKYVLDAVNSNGSGNTVKVHFGNAQGDVVLVDNDLVYGLRYHQPVFELGLPFVYTSDLAADETGESWMVRYDNLLVRWEQR
jgi:hypothetical protein